MLDSFFVLSFVWGFGFWEGTALFYDLRKAKVYTYKWRDFYFLVSPTHSYLLLALARGLSCYSAWFLVFLRDRFFYLSWLCLLSCVFARKYPPSHLNTGVVVTGRLVLITVNWEFVFSLRMFYSSTCCFTCCGAVGVAERRKEEKGTNKRERRKKIHNRDARFWSGKFQKRVQINTYSTFGKSVKQHGGSRRTKQTSGLIFLETELSVLIYWKWMNKQQTTRTMARWILGYTAWRGMSTWDTNHQDSLHSSCPLVRVIHPVLLFITWSKG